MDGREVIFNFISLHLLKSGKKSYYFHQGAFNLLVLSFLSIETLIKSMGLPTPIPFPTSCDLRTLFNFKLQMTKKLDNQNFNMMSKSSNNFASEPETLLRLRNAF